MRARSNWLFRPKVKATWVAIAAGSLAGLAVLGACSDAPISKIAGPKVPEPRFAEIGANARQVAVCIDATSTPGTYTFSIAQGLGAPYNFPMFEPIGQSDPDFGFGGNPVQETDGPWEGDKIVGNTALTTQTVTLGTPGSGSPDCAIVFERATTTDNLGNRLWTYNPGTQSEQLVNRAGTVVITPPSNATYTATCINDDPNLAQTPGCTGGPIVATETFSSANVFHGSVVTYLATRTETPCPAGTFTFEIADGSGDESRWPAGNPGDLLIRYDQFPAPNDNSYGANAVGWPNGHTFGNLTGSDKAGVQIKNMSGTVILSFNMDYLSSTTRSATIPSGYASLGVTGGDGGMLIGTATGISVTTSLASNLNKTGYCAAPPAAVNCTVAGTNLLVDSPPTDGAHQTYDLANPGAHGLWDFHDTYYARIDASKLATFGQGWVASSNTVQPNLTVLHNSPAKPCPPGPFNCDDITVGTKSFGSKEVKSDVNNINVDQDAFITGVHITWPAANGALKSIKVGGDVIWTGTINGTSANLLLADLVADASKRKIGKKSDEDIKFTFANNVTQTLGLYTASLDFGATCNKAILP